MIPKIIHYCWFGRNEMPEKFKACIKSWKEKMPDYEIICWNEDNYDVNKCQYIKDAYEMKKWAFVSDYVRLDVCYTYGGIYLDTDVEVIKSFDELLNLNGFCGMEIGKNCLANEVNVGLALGMIKGLPIGKILRDDYHSLRFIKKDGTLDLTPCPTIQTRVLVKHGLKLNNEQQTIDDMTVFPTRFFCPMNQYTGDIVITPDTFSIHHYAGSWVLPVDKKRRNLRIKYSKYGKTTSEIISTYIAYKEEYGLVKMWKKIFLKLKK